MFVKISDDDQLREVALPDIDARSLMGNTEGSMSMVAGDFVVRCVCLVFCDCVAVGGVQSSREP